MGKKRKVLSGFELGGQSPDSLTIAEYLKALGNGSSRPAPSSGSVPEAYASVVQLGRKTSQSRPPKTAHSAQPAAKPDEPAKPDTGGKKRLKSGTSATPCGRSRQ